MNLLNFALRKLEKGCPVFPVDRITKKPHVEWKAYQERLPTEVEVTAWWTRWPNANIGMATGHLSGLVVVDCDSHEATDHFIEEYPDSMKTLQVQTGRGRHYYYKFEEGIHNDAGKLLGPGIDTRGEGGFVIVPPSIHANGKVYKWINIENKPIALSERLRDILVNRVRNDASNTPASEGFRERFDTPRALAGVPEGQRDDTVFRLACRLRNADVPQDMAKELILKAARSCQPPFPDTRALEKVHRAYESYSAAGAEPQKAKNTLPLTSLKDLLAEEDENTEWLVEGLLPKGGFSIHAGKPKAGKSTLARNLAMLVARGELFLGKTTTKGPVIYLALEEKRSEVKKHFQSMGCTGEEEIFIYASGAPVDALERIRAVAEEKHPALIIIDPLFRFTRVKDGNDYAEMTQALDPLLRLSRETGTHVMCVHHLGKGERPVEDAILGSTAIFSAVDTALFLKRTDRYRIISSQQRYGEPMEETVLSFDSETRTITLGESREQEEINRLKA